MSFAENMPEILLTVNTDGLPDIPVFCSQRAMEGGDPTDVVALIRLLLQLAVDGLDAGEEGDGDAVHVRAAQMIGVVRGLDTWQRGMMIVGAMDALTGLWRVVSHAHSVEEIEGWAAEAGYGRLM